MTLDIGGIACIKVQTGKTVDRNLVLPPSEDKQTTMRDKSEPMEGFMCPIQECGFCPVGCDLNERSTLVKFAFQKVD